MITILEICVTANLYNPLPVLLFLVYIAWCSDTDQLNVVGVARRCRLDTKILQLLFNNMNIIFITINPFSNPITVILC